MSVTWTRIALAALLVILATSLSDWLFFGVLFHEKYLAHPEVWRRPRGGAGESEAIAWSSVIGAISAIAFIAFCVGQGRLAWPQTLGLAGLLWVVAALPILLNDAIFIKIHPLTTVAHACGWLVRFTIAAAVTSALLS